MAQRQPDTDRLVTWEVAGTAHADQSQLDWGNASVHVIDPEFAVPDFEAMCGGTLNQGPQSFVLQRAWADLIGWVVEGTPPATAPPLEIDANGAIRRDDLGIAVGRTASTRWSPRPTPPSCRADDEARTAFLLPSPGE